jgi:acyl carrier protein
VLNIGGIGARDDFFDIGGDSLAATQLILLLQERFGVNIAAETLMTRANTIAGQVEEIGRRKRMDVAILDVDFVDFEAAMQNRPALYQVDKATGLRVARPNVTIGPIATNSLGFRSPEINKAKPPGTIRLMFLGSSGTYDVLVSSNEATWPHQTWLRLREAYPQLTIDYANCSLPASGTTQVLKRYKSGLAELSADIVIIRLNDLIRDAAYQARAQGVYDGVHHKKSWLARRGGWFLDMEKNVVIASRLLFPNHWPRKIKFDVETATRAFAENLEALVTQCRQDGATVVLFQAMGMLRREGSFLQQRRAAARVLYYTPFMTLPGLLEARYAYARVHREVAEKTGALFIDIGTAVPADWTHFADADHFQDAGSRVAAQAFSQALIDAGVVTSVAKAAGLPSAT